MDISRLPHYPGDPVGRGRGWAPRPFSVHVWSAGVTPARSYRTRDGDVILADLFPSHSPDWSGGTGADPSTASEKTNAFGLSSDSNSAARS